VIMRYFGNKPMHVDELTQNPTRKFSRQFDFFINSSNLTFTLNKN